MAIAVAVKYLGPTNNAGARLSVKTFEGKTTIVNRDYGLTYVKQGLQAATDYAATNYEMHTYIGSALVNKNTVVYLFSM